MPTWLVWLLVAAGFGVAEVLTLGLVLGMFALAAAVAAVTAAAGADPVVQVIVFVVVSPLLLGFARPVATRHLRQPLHTRTGVQALVGERALVLEPVNADNGRVKLRGEVWSARSYDESQVIPVGATVDVVGIDGATALVYLPATELP